MLRRALNLFVFRLSESKVCSKHVHVWLASNTVALRAIVLVASPPISTHYVQFFFSPKNSLRKSCFFWNSLFVPAVRFGLNILHGWLSDAALKSALADVRVISARTDASCRALRFVPRARRWSQLWHSLFKQLRAKAKAGFKKKSSFFGGMHEQKRCALLTPTCERAAHAVRTASGEHQALCACVLEQRLPKGNTFLMRAKSLTTTAP